MQAVEPAVPFRSRYNVYKAVNQYLVEHQRKHEYDRITDKHFGGDNLKHQSRPAQGGNPEGKRQEKPQLPFLPAFPAE
ncbi:hypothetical protein FACS1894182_00240 [Bacteroidia bacterium]|nr:hypothetical protein FACS1894182_00240 [Bacteroidia bacterium]